MNKRPLILGVVFAALGMVYIFFFTEWIRPEPIQIASQVRAVIHPPRFGRPPAETKKTNASPMKVEAPAKSDMAVLTNTVVKGATNPARRVIDLPDWGKVEQAPGGVANVTFSLDSRYTLTALRVVDVPADGSAPKVAWSLIGKSLPTSTLLYGRDPLGMKPMTPGAKAELLVANVPYRLVIEAGRRRGTNFFKTTPIVAR